MDKVCLTFLLTSFFVFTSFGQKKKDSNLKKAIICLTYDDGLESELNIAIPQLDSFGLKATFFLNSIHPHPRTVLGWTNAAKGGHELANHTLFHACPGKYGWDKTIAIENYSVDRMITEIKTESALLALLDPSRKERTFAFPCNNFLIGDIDYISIIHKLGLIKYARAGGDSTSIITDFKNLNSLKVPSWHVWEGTTLSELIAFAEKVKKVGGMGIYQFHDVDGQLFSISSETHKAFLQYLKMHQDKYWVTTFSEAMDFVTKPQAK